MRGKRGIIEKTSDRFSGEVDFFDFFRDNAESLATAKRNLDDVTWLEILV